MTAAAQRQELLDMVENVLKNPGKYGDRFLVQMLQTTKDGLISIKLLHEMVTILKEYPEKYISYCIPLDEKNRFVASFDRMRVGLKSCMQDFETSAYGFVSYDLHSEHEPEDSVMPVLFDGGKFYIDLEHTRKRDPDYSTAHLYSYNKIDMRPLGLESDLEYKSFPTRSCFNCGNENHSVNDCPEPHNKFRIREKRALAESEKGPAFDRIHIEISRQAEFEKLRPGVLTDKLKDALGMNERSPEPPYYKWMRAHGYPPGYMGYSSENKEEALKKILNLDFRLYSTAPMLKIYQDTKDISEEEEAADIDSPRKNIQDRVQLVEYPGLNLIEYPDYSKFAVEMQPYHYAYQQHPQQQNYNYQYPIENRSDEGKIYDAYWSNAYAWQLPIQDVDVYNKYPHSTGSSFQPSQQAPAQPVEQEPYPDTISRNITENTASSSTQLEHLLTVDDDSEDMDISDTD